MPETKNAIARYRILDALLSDRNHEYSMTDLKEVCNQRLDIAKFPNVSKRSIEKDLHALESLFGADIEVRLIEGKPRYHYADRHFSIFRKELKREEQQLLAEFLNTLGQFEGLAHFEWFEAFRRGIKLEKRSKIISFSNNPYLQGSNLLGTLFGYIANRIVIRLCYHTFANAEQKEIPLHPYLLKQYNDRWFLFGADDKDDRILSFPLDRIDEVTPLPARKYRQCKVDLNERFEEIIGVSFYEENPVEHITFWVGEHSLDYVQTKPIHGSQTPIRGDHEQGLRSRYSHLQGGAFFSIDCRANYELYRELRSFGSSLLVLSPESIQDKVYEEIAKMKEEYNKLRT